jgi:hypothetical protein
VTARYQVHVSDELVEAWDLSMLPVGMRLVEIGPLDVMTRSRAATFDDDEAPEDLNGKTVYPLFQLDTVTGKVTIVGRGVVS